MSSKELSALAVLIAQYARIPGQPERIDNLCRELFCDVTEAYKQTLTTK